MITTEETQKYLSRALPLSDPRAWVGIIIILAGIASMLYWGVWPWLTAIFFYIFLLLIFRTVATTICVHLGKDKDAVVLGWEVGLFLGWIGAITMQVISAGSVRSPATRHHRRRGSGADVPRGV